MTKQTKPQSDSIRLQTVLDLLGITSYRLSQDLNYSTPSTIYHVINGRNNLSLGLIEKIVNRYPSVNYLYLKTGKGEPLLKSHSEQIAQKNMLDGRIPFEAPKEPEPQPSRYNMAEQLQQLIDNSEKLNETVGLILQEQQEIKKEIRKLLKK